MRTFETTRQSEKSPEALLPEVLGGITSPLADWGYELTTQSDRTLSYVRQYRPWFIWLGAICLFPIGLLFLLYKQSAALTVVFESTGAGTVVRVNGMGEKRVQRAFEQMQL